MNHYSIAGVVCGIPDDQIVAPSFVSGMKLKLRKEPESDKTFDVTVNNHIDVDPELKKIYGCLVSPTLASDLCVDDFDNNVITLIEPEIDIKHSSSGFRGGIKMEKLKRNINHIETIKQLDTMFYREGRPYRLFLNKHPRAKEFDNGCYVLCTEACSGSVTFVKVSGTITHEKIHTNIISLNTREIDQYEITVMGCIDDNEVLNIIDKVKANPDEWHGMRDFEYIKGIGMPAEMDPLPDNYVYVKGDKRIPLFQLNQFDQYEVNLYRIHELREGLYAMILTRNDDNTCVEINCTIELYPFDIYVNYISDNGCTHQYQLTITKLMNDYKSLKIMSMKEYHEIMTEEKTKEE